MITNLINVFCVVEVARIRPTLQLYFFKDNSMFGD